MERKYSVLNEKASPLANSAGPFAPGPAVVLPNRAELSGGFGGKQSPDENDPTPAYLHPMSDATPPSADYFAFYGLPESFQPDEAALKRLYYAKSRETHPDFHATSAPDNQAEMLRQATLNTDAYRTLADADQRMAYLLRHHGLLVEGQSEQLPPDFLMDVMDLNEQLMELEMDPSPAAVGPVAAEAQALADTLDAGIKPVLAGYEQLPADHRPAALRQVLTYYLKKRYLLRIQRQVATFTPPS